jgi:mannose-1-phosphate guanylyltransferase
MKAVLLVGGFSTQLRPLTLSQPLPLLDFCNQTLVYHQLQALKDAGISEVILCYPEQQVPPSWDESIRQLEGELGLKLTCSCEDSPAGTAGALKRAESLITDGSTNDSPFIVVNADVLCSYPLRDLLLAHVKHGLQGTILTTKTASPNECARGSMTPLNTHPRTCCLTPGESLSAHTHAATRAQAHPTAPAFHPFHSPFSSSILVPPPRF